MCGILFILTSENTGGMKPNEDILTNIKRRGPDFFDEVAFTAASSWYIYSAASVLHTQGDTLTKQPLKLFNGDILLWNGDVFDGSVLAEIPRVNMSDTHILAEWLKLNDCNILELVTKIKGPYSFIYFSRLQNRLWFGRDPLGRHSLLWKISKEQIFLSSVGHKSIPDLKEVPAVGLFCVSIERAHVETELYRWSHVNGDILMEDLPASISTSNGQINVFNKLQMSSSDQIFDVEFFFSVTNFVSNLETMKSLLRNPKINAVVNDLLVLLQESCQKRIIYQRNCCINCLNEDSCSQEHVKFAVLFSGGIDSTIIACIADKFVPKTDSIDLLNVAFDHNDSFEVPDRKTGRLSLIELQTLCPDRVWNFVEINVTQEELNDIRKNRISHLIYPLNTVLDESLGCAVWFGCRGKGYLGNAPYSSTAKILFLGSGADEQFGGYVRHKNLLRRNDWRELQQQLLKETLSISKRNLGRDDRVACDSGRQPRFPFLDESVVEYVAGLPAWQKCSPVKFPSGVGDKLILRLVAVKLGLVQCATFPKRAFQFGCRIAKAKEKGNDCSERL